MVDSPGSFTAVGDDELLLDDELQAVYEKPTAYKRDVLRRLGVALDIDGAVNMNKTPLVRVIKKYKQQRDDGIPF